MYLSADEIKDIVLNVSKYKYEKDDRRFQEGMYNITTNNDVVINNNDYITKKKENLR